MKKGIVILIVLGILLTSCASLPNQEVAPAVSALATLSDLRDALNGVLPAFVFKDGNGNYCIAWVSAAKDTVRFVFFDSNFKYPVLKFIQDAKGNATQVNFQTWVDFKNFMVQSGWKQINPSQLPLTITTGILSNAAWMGEILPTLPMIIFIPSVLDLEQFQKEYLSPEFIDG